MNKSDLVLNNLQWLIWYQSKPNQIVSDLNTSYYMTVCEKILKKSQHKECEHEYSMNVIFKLMPLKSIDQSINLSGIGCQR